MIKLCHEHETYTIGCVTCQEDMTFKIEELTKYLDEIVDMIQCTCHEAYSVRKLVDPSCSYHDINNVIEDYKKSKE